MNNSDKCDYCKFVFYDNFCSYECRNCQIHGTIDCNPDSYLNTLNGECPDFIIKIKKDIRI